jgi:polysaccharide export outer membrane protein
MNTRLRLLSVFTGTIVSLNATPCLSLPLSPGDRLKVSIPEGELFNGIYEVNIDGTLQIPYLSPIRVAGLEPSQIEQTLSQGLIEKRLFNPRFLQVTIQPVEWSAIQVSVAGATFQPGRLLLNQRSPEARARITQSSGDYPPERFLIAAIREAGGVMPNADVKNIRLIRNGQETTIDLSGVLSGDIIQDIPLVAGDRIVVPNTQKVHPELIRPSQITIAGVRVFLSNLTQPASSNSGASVNKDATSFVYGSRLSQAVIAGNCAGGSTENAKRRALLVRTDRMTGETKMMERPIEDLLRKTNDDVTNPFLMPDDGVACYDSKRTNLRGVADTLGAIFSPFSLLLNLLRK